MIVAVAPPGLDALPALRHANRAQVRSYKVKQGIHA
jgi:hypothetical protein